MKHHALRLSTLVSAAAENKPFLQTIQILAHKLKHEFFLLYEVEFKSTFWYKNTVGTHKSFGSRPYTQLLCAQGSERTGTAETAHWLSGGSLSPV